MTQFRTISTAVVIATFAAGCAKDVNLSPETESVQDEPLADSQSFIPAELPSLADADCDRSEAPDVCDWANSVDAIVVANIDSVVPLTAPVWVDDSENSHIASDCEGGILHVGGAFNVSVTSVLYGSAPSDLVVLLGARGTNSWGEEPEIDESTGRFRWSGMAVGEGPLQSGTTVGLAISKVPGTSDWALYGEMPFTFHADGTAEFLSPRCGFRSPDPRPADFWSLQSALKACSTSHSPAYQTRVNQYTQNPAWSHAALCRHPRPDIDAGPADAGTDQ